MGKIEIKALTKPILGIFFLKNKYITNAKVSIFTKDSLTYLDKGVVEKTKTEYGYDYIINIKEI